MTLLYMLLLCYGPADTRSALALDHQDHNEFPLINFLLLALPPFIDRT